MSKALLRTDGGAAPRNPGHAGIACVIEIDGEKKVLSRYIGRHTNNYAEFTALIVGVKYAKELGATELEIIMDSQLVVFLVNDKWKGKKHHIRELKKDAQKVLNDLFPDAWTLKWERRDNNDEADDLCTKAINKGLNRNPWTPARKKEKRVGEVHDPFAR